MATRRAVKSSAKRLPPRKAGVARKRGSGNREQQSREGTQPAAERKRVPWRATEQAIDTDEARGSNDVLARRLGITKGSWRRLHVRARKYLGIDVRPLCDAFDAENRGYLPRGMVHLWIEPVVAHFSQHLCCDGSPLEPVCAYARAIYVIAAALEQTRMEGWRARPIALLERAKATVLSLMPLFGDEVETLRKSFKLQPRDHEEKARLLGRMEHHWTLLEKLQTQYAKDVRDSLGAPELIADRGDARRALVFAEGELLALQGMKARRVSELIVELRNTSDPAKQVSRRARLVSFELRLQIVRPGVDARPS